MERQKFEESWKNAFEQAEVSPSTEVWTNVELALERQEGGKLKRRILFYKMLAAASVVFAMAIAGVGYYNSYVESQGQNGKLLTQNTDAPSKPGSEQQAEQTNKAVQPTDGVSTDSPEGDPSLNASAESDANGRNQMAVAEPDGKSLNTAVEKDNTTINADPSARANDHPAPIAKNSNSFAKNNATSRIGADAVAQSANDNTPPGVTAAISITEDTQRTEVFATTSKTYDRQLPQLVRLRPMLLTFPKTEPDRIDLWLAGLAEEEKKSKKEAREETLWTAVGFSAGAFNAVNSGASADANTFADANFLSAANSSLSNESSASGVSYSIGLNVGGKVARRWVLQGGVNYLTNYAEFTSNAVVTDLSNFKAATSVELNKLSTSSTSRDKVVPTAPYSVTSNLEYISVPVQAGYLLVNRAFGIQINGGVSTDMFIQSKLTPKGENLDPVSQSAGKESPYRTINFSGLFGTEFTYKFASHYRVSLNPGIRYPLNSIYKSDIDLESSPLTFDIGLRFRYIFQ